MNTTTATLQQPRISLDVFSQLVNSLSPEQLSHIPPEKLPVNIPHNLIDSAAPEIKEVLEDLLFEAEAYQLSEQVKIESRFGGKVARAIDLSRDTGSEALNHSLKPWVNKLELMYDKWQHTEDREQFKVLLSLINKVEALLPEVKSDSSLISTAYQSLTDSMDKAGQYQLIFGEARQILSQQATEIDHYLGKYFVLRLMIIGVEMQRTAHKIQEMDDRANELDQKIKATQKQIQELTRLNEGGQDQELDRPRLEALKYSLEKMLGEREEVDVFISENDLVEWLDLVVDATISPVTASMRSARAGDIRMALFQLLVRYCKCQEEAAMKVASNPYGQADPEQVIRFMLKSEAFILDYFANKRRDLMEWLGEAAQKKMESLKDIENKIIGVLHEKISEHK